MTKGINYFLASLIVTFSFVWGINAFKNNLDGFLSAQVSSPADGNFFVKTTGKPEQPTLKLNAKSAISFEINKSGRGKIVYEKNSILPLPIASLSKLMTALIVVGDPGDYNLRKLVIVSKTAAGQDNVPEGGNLKIGEKKTVGELLDLMMTYSSNDAAMALSEIIGTENFVERMNKKAEEIGLSDTYFKNPTGLDPGNLNFDLTYKYYFNNSTAQDLAKLAQYILNEFPIIFEISLNNSKFSEFSLMRDFNLIGGKTGYTFEAGGCMLLVLENDGNYYINVVLGADSQVSRVTEMQKMINWLTK